MPGAYSKRETVVQFNTDIRVITQTIVEAAKEEKSPFICKVSESALKYMGFNSLLQWRVPGPKKI
ncbi:class II fructose-bisphosphate aldolase [Paenibacillus sp. FSL K6-3182]|uniref:class II fructose-bisphosphate aldolase n=1 Tax=Paenibacillus sp. FSL K6-3182 TaxID=2921495 RepID=UPI0030CBAEA0